MFGLKARQLFFILFFVAVVYVASHSLLPVYYQAFQFEDFVYQEVKFAASKRKPTEKIRASIADEAKNSDIPVSRAISTSRSAARHSASKSIIADRRSACLSICIWPQHVVTAGQCFENDRN